MKTPSTTSDLIAKIPYITAAPRDGRTLILLPFFDHSKNEWVQYILDKGEFLPIQVMDLVQGLYLSRSAADSARDYYYFLATFVFQHLSFKSVAARYLELEKTVHYFACCLENYHRISSSSYLKDDSLLVEAELSYLLILMRRFYDLIQKTMAAASALVKDVKDPSRSLIKKLPGSFAAMVQADNNVRTSQEIADKWKLPKQIADLYFAEANHFLLIRSIRVGLEHHGKSLGIIFNHPDGYAVSISSHPWSSLPIWNETNTRPNGLGSVRAIMAYLISDALDLGSRFVKAYWSCIGTPRAIAGNSKCYLRNPYSHHLNSLSLMMEQPWERYGEKS